MPFVLCANPTTADMGTTPGIKVSINSHGDPLQPAAGDVVATGNWINTENGRRRIWAQVGAVSVGTADPVAAIASELDVNNDSGAEPSEPGGPRSLYGQWISGSSSGPYLGSAAQLVTSADGSRWKAGIFIDRADVGIRIGGTFQNGLGLDLAQSRVRMREFTASPPNPPPNTADLYLQDNGAGKSQLVIRFANGPAIVLATEP